MDKITWEEYQLMVEDPEVDEEKILEYSIVTKGKGGFDFELEPNPEKVELSDELLEEVGAMQTANAASRFRRRAAFNLRKAAGSTLPILVAEGDSWFQFPIIVKEIVDQLKDDYLIWSIAAAGDTAQNMVFDNPEYSDAITRHKDDIKAFLFSAAGNDIIGQDLETGEPVLLEILKEFDPQDPTNVEKHINIDLLDRKLTFLKEAYEKVIRTIRQDLGLIDLPILIHGYDYPFPYPWNEDDAEDPRNPLHADNDEWLGKPMRQRNIQRKDLRRGILEFLINRLYEMLQKLIDDSHDANIMLVDCRRSMPDVGDWIDEIHGTSAGFQKVAARFHAALNKALA